MHFSELPATLNVKASGIEISKCRLTNLRTSAQQERNEGFTKPKEQLNNYVVIIGVGILNHLGRNYPTGNPTCPSSL